MGSIAAAMFLGFYDRVAPTMPRFVMVEPNEADCLYRSAVAGRPVPSAGSLHTIMAGLACREVSPAAWQVLDWLTSDFVTIPDAWAAEAMRALADGDDTPIVWNRLRAASPCCCTPRKSRPVPAAGPKP